MRFVSFSLLCLLLASCATPHMQAPSSAISGNDGTSIDSAIMIDEKSEGAGVQAEYRWIGAHYPDFQRGAQSVLNKNGRIYDRIEFTTSEGESKAAYFDITSFFGKM